MSVPMAEAAAGRDTERDIQGRLRRQTHTWRMPEPALSGHPSILPGAVLPTTCGLMLCWGAGRSQGLAVRGREDLDVPGAEECSWPPRASDILSCFVGNKWGRSQSLSPSFWRSRSTHGGRPMRGPGPHWRSHPRSLLCFCCHSGPGHSQSWRVGGQAISSSVPGPTPRSHPGLHLTRVGIVTPVTRLHEGLPSFALGALAITWLCLSLPDVRVLGRHSLGNRASRFCTGPCFLSACMGSLRLHSGA